MVRDRRRDIQPQGPGPLKWVGTGPVPLTHGLGRRDCAVHVRVASFGDPMHKLACRGVVHVAGPAARGLHPTPGDELNRGWDTVG